MRENNRSVWCSDGIGVKFWLKDLVSTKKFRKYIGFPIIFLLLRQWTEKGHLQPVLRNY